MSVKGADPAQDLKVYVQSVAVTDKADRGDSFTFTLKVRPPASRGFAGGPDLVWLDSDLFDEGTEVEIHMGYGSDLSLLLQGVVTGTTPSFPQGGLPTLTVRGSSHYRKLQQKHRRKPFESSTDSDLAAEAASDLGLNSVVQVTEAQIPLISPKGLSYAEILRKRAERIDYEVVVKETTLYFERPGYITNPSPVLTLEWGRDLSNFTPDLSSFEKVTKVTVRSSQTAQGRGKAPIVGVAEAGQESEIMGDRSASQIARDAFGEKEILYEDHNVANQQEANDIAQAQLDAKSIGYISGSGSCIGNPHLRARSVIRLEGLGRRFSGNYYVTSATHTINASGYITSFEVKKNGR